MQNLTIEEKRKYVQDFKGLIVLRDIAKEINISLTLLSQIISGDRTDHYNALDKCYNEIEKKINNLMPSHK